MLCKPTSLCNMAHCYFCVIFFQLLPCSACSSHTGLLAASLNIPDTRLSLYWLFPGSGMFFPHNHILQSSPHSDFSLNTTLSVRTSWLLYLHLRRVTFILCTSYPFCLFYFSPKLLIAYNFMPDSTTYDTSFNFKNTKIQSWETYIFQIESYRTLGKLTSPRHKNYNCLSMPTIILLKKYHVLSKTVVNIFSHLDYFYTTLSINFILK